MKSSILALLAVALTVLAAPTLHEARSEVDLDGSVEVDSTIAVRAPNLADDSSYGPDYSKYKTYGRYRRGVDDDYSKYGKYKKYESYGDYKDDGGAAQE